MSPNIHQLQAQGRTILVYLETTTIKHLSNETRKSLFEKIRHYGFKVYQTDSARELLKYNKPCVIRYGHLPDYILNKLRITGACIVPGDL